jgi:tRNA dimethylallyltransferase
MNTSDNNKSIVIVGPTAVGKTEYAIEIAQKYNGQIVSADSMQIYKGFDIGSAKPTVDELSAVKHHLIDIIDPLTDFSVAEYQKLATDIIKDLFKNDIMPVIAGGTGLYVNSLLYDMDFSHTGKQDRFREKMECEAQQYGNEYMHKLLEVRDPEAAKRIHPNNLKRVIRALELLETSEGEYSLRSFDKSFKPRGLMNPLIIFLNRDREELYERINRRVDILVAKGLIEEVETLKRSGLSNNHISMKGIGYKEIAEYLDGSYDREHAIYLVKRNSRRYAKRQITWFKRYSDGHQINLSDFNTKDEGIKQICVIIDTFLK